MKIILPAITPGEWALKGPCPQADANAKTAAAIPAMLEAISSALPVLKEGIDKLDWAHAHRGGHHTDPECQNRRAILEQLKSALLSAGAVIES
jgi:hypothetical protein